MYRFLVVIEKVEDCLPIPKSQSISEYIAMPEQVFSSLSAS